MFFFFKQKTAYEMRISDWSSDVCSSDLLGVGVGENDPAGGWFGLPLAIPAIDQFAARRFARVGSVDHIAVRIGADRLAGPSGSQLPGGVLLPTLVLAAHLGDFNTAMPFMDRAERRTRLDRKSTRLHSSHSC